MIKSLFPNSIESYQSFSFIEDSRVGKISHDFSATIGYDGWIFIFNGSNDYRASYFDYSHAQLGNDWVDLIINRESYFNSLGIDFVQLIVPNKATLIPEKYPEHLGNGMSVILQRLLSFSPSPCLLCPILEMRHPLVRYNLFRKNDSHLTMFGNAFITNLILKKLNIKQDINAALFLTKIEHFGDLGSKFEPQISEVFHAPIFDEGLLDLSKVNKYHEVILDGFIGIEQSFINHSFIYDKKILVFGNSFFEKCPSWGMSPFFVSLFREFHFVWSPHIDHEKVHALKPDIVIAQTCERFLNKLPLL
jgi:hypothetical protein